MILLDLNARPVIGHRGNRAHAPENTLESLQQAVALGVDAVEFDVHVSADGVLVVMHDPTIDRTTSGTGAVSALRLSQLRAHDAGARFTTDRGRTYPWRGRGLRIPTFDEVIDILPRDLPMIVELKTPAASALLQRAISHHQLADRIIVGGFAAASTRPFHGGRAAVGACTPDVVRALLPAVTRRRVHAPPYQALCIPPMHNGIPVPIEALARAVRPAGVVTHVWTINDPAHAQRLWRQGVQGIISDDPAAILVVRGT